MQQSYSKNYLKIYFWQLLSIALGFLSLFWVVPYLSSEPAIYGIYSVCISVSVFLSYADLGFLSAGQKYAAEAYANRNTVKEIEFIGFSHFVLLVFVLFLSVLFLWFSFNPDVLIKNLEHGEQFQIAHKLILILAIFAPVIVLQRMSQMIFAIRLQEYKIQRLIILGNVLKIGSVFLFFRGGRYDIVSYFLFLQIVNLIVAIIGMILACKIYQNNIIGIIQKIKFSKTVYNHTKSLAFSTIFITITWILYYELDLFAIGHLLGAQQVAIYAIAFTLLSFFRSLLGVLFTPFVSRFNHFVGLGQLEELRKFFLHVVTITFPLVVFPIVAVVIFSEPLVISWVGPEFVGSVRIVQLLILCNVFAFISYPVGMLLMALKEVKKMYVFNGIMPVIYWGGIYITINVLSVESFALFKLIIFVVSAVMYTVFALKFLQMSFINIIQKFILSYIPALVVLILILLPVNDLYIDGKNKLFLFYNAALIALSVSIAMFVSYLFSKPLRSYVNQIMIGLRK